MTPVRIIGIGSPFGQDQLGLQVITMLEEHHFAARFPPALISLQRSDRPGAMLVELFNDAELVILIDALSITGKRQPFVRWLDARELATEPVLFSSHSFGISEAIQLARVLGVLPRRLRILALAMSDDEDTTGIDPEIYTAIENALVEEINTIEQLADDL